ncbi:MAG: UbiA family prenyltransferase [Thermoplasmata archaeon]|nr:UbiA family prenyltransferase [Thermoplasmata archaeon]
MTLSKIQKFREYLKLSRIPAAGSAWLLISIGALAQGGTAVSWHHLLYLFPPAVMTYVLALVMNEYIDVDVDRESKSLATKPLVARTVTMREAVWICWLSGIFALIYIFALWGWAAALWYTVSVGMGAMYNLNSKKHYWVDYFEGVWAAMVCMLGGMTITSSSPWELRPLVYVLSFMWLMRLAIVNSIGGGMKDLENDQAVRAKTLPTWFGVKMEGKRIIYTASWWAYEGVTEGAFVAAIVLPVCLGYYAFKELQIAVIGLFMFGWLITLRGITPRIWERDSIKKNALVHEILSFAIMVAMVIGVAGWQKPVAILAIPILWFIVFARIAYGKSLPTV